MSDRRQRPKLFLRALLDVEVTEAHDTDTHDMFRDSWHVLLWRIQRWGWRWLTDSLVGVRTKSKELCGKDSSYSQQD